MPKVAFFFCLGSALRLRASVAMIAVLTLFLFLVVIGAPVARAQESTTRNELWPEIDVYIDVKPKLRLYLLGTVSKSVRISNRSARRLHSQRAYHPAHGLSFWDLGGKN